MALPLSLPSPRAFFAFLFTPLYWTTFHHYLEAWNSGNEVHYRGLENYKSSHAVLGWFACGPQLSYGGRTATFNLDFLKVVRLVFWSLALRAHSRATRSKARLVSKSTFNPKVFRRSDTSFSWQCCSPCSVSSKAYLIFAVISLFIQLLPFAFFISSLVVRRSSWLFFRCFGCSTWIDTAFHPPRLKLAHA